jgi:hypothetical protein
MISHYSKFLLDDSLGLVPSNSVYFLASELLHDSFHYPASLRIAEDKNVPNITGPVQWLSESFNLNPVQIQLMSTVPEAS